MDRWECRYSSAEMYYLELGPNSVRAWLCHSPDKAAHWSFAEVLAGAIDAEVRALFDDRTLEELKAAVRSRTDGAAVALKPPTGG
jgi:hypothetical protein